MSKVFAVPFNLRYLKYPRSLPPAPSPPSLLPSLHTHTLPTPSPNSFMDVAVLDCWNIITCSVLGWKNNWRKYAGKGKHLHFVSSSWQEYAILLLITFAWHTRTRAQMFACTHARTHTHTHINSKHTSHALLSIYTHICICGIEVQLSTLYWFSFFQICKHFLEAVENSKYGWFWNCPNGPKCIYRHALPPGFVLKKDQKKEEKEEQISLEDLIEREASLSFSVSHSSPGVKTTCWYIYSNAK